MGKIYYPSAWNLSKYGKFIIYLWYYLTWNDFTSIRESFRYLLKRKGARKEYVAYSEMGMFYIRKDSNDYQFINRAYERKVKKYLEREVGKESFMWFIDVGACIGEYSIWLAKKGIYCHAYEPVDSNFMAMKKNADNNLHMISYNDDSRGRSFSYASGRSHLRMENFALGSKEETKTIVMPSIVMSSSYISNEENEGNTCQVKKLDDVFWSKPEPVIMKIDAEGHDKEVILGAKEFIKSQKHLRIIYERYPNDNSIETLLQSISRFEIKKLDRYNYLAVKIH